MHCTLISYPDVNFVVDPPLCIDQEQYQHRRGTILRSKSWHTRNRLQPHQRDLNHCFYHPISLPSIPRRLFENEHIDPVFTIFPLPSEILISTNPPSHLEIVLVPPRQTDFLLLHPQPFRSKFNLQTFSKNSPSSPSKKKILRDGPTRLLLHRPAQCVSPLRNSPAILKEIFVADFVCFLPSKCKEERSGGCLK